MNILVLTSIYPQKDDDKKSGITPVVHYFAREWAKDNNVIVIHNANKYPKIFYRLPDKFIQKINSKLGIVVPKACQSKKTEITHEGVKIKRLPILKVIPRTKINRRQISSQYKEIVEYIESNNFTPDVIIGHWENPQIPLISMLKKRYNCRTALVFHGLNYMDKKSAYKWKERYFSDIDTIGCRSKSMAIEIKDKLDLRVEPFVCYSGVPKSYVECIEENKINKTSVERVEKYIFVGQLIERKYVDTIIKSLQRCYGNKGFELDIVGIGACEEKLKKLVERLGISECVKFWGRLNRDDVVKLMDKSQCFTMVSKNEAFGLVYLEAMAKGCIVIASRGEGMDGIIVDGVNGFLCKAGDDEELERIYNRINDMDKEEKRRITENAIKTVRMFTDEEVSKRYLNEVL